MRETSEFELPPEIVARINVPPSALRRLLDSTPLLTALSLSLILMAWHLVKVVFTVPDFTLPSPSAVGLAIVENWSRLLLHLSITLQEIVLGFLLAIAVGFPTAVGIAYSRLFDRLTYPVLVSTQAIPKIAIGPIIVTWLGFGFRPNVFIAFTVAVFPIVMNTALGLKSIDQDFIRLARSMGASGWRTFWKIRLPNALPNVFAGLKLGITFATIGAIVGEFIAGSRGLGYLVLAYSGEMRTVNAFASLVVLAGLAVALFYVVEIMEWLIVRWRRGEDVVTP